MLVLHVMPVQILMPSLGCLFGWKLFRRRRCCLHLDFRRRQLRQLPVGWWSMFWRESIMLIYKNVKVCPEILPFLSVPESH